MPERLPDGIQQNGVSVRPGGHQQTRTSTAVPPVAIGTVVDEGWCVTSEAETCPVNGLPRLQAVPPAPATSEPEVCDPVVGVGHTTVEPEVHHMANQHHGPPVGYQAGMVHVQPVGSQAEPLSAPFARTTGEPERILVSEKHSVQVLHPSIPGQPNYLPTPGPVRTRVFKHSEDYRLLTGEVTRWRQTWRLRYAEVHDEDLYGGSVDLVGDTQLDQLQDGQFVQARGFLTPPEGLRKSPSFRVQGLQVLQP